MRAFEILNEMVVRTPRIDDNENLIAHRDSIWLVPSEDIDPEVMADIVQRTGLTAANTFYSLEEEGRDSRPDILFGYLDDDSLHIMANDDTGLNPITSLLIKKVVKQLGLRSVDQNQMDGDGSEYDQTTYRHEMLGRIPDIVFHGTNSRFMNEIRSKGLGPNENANWERVGKFYDRVFFAARQQYAMFHANRSAEKGGIPIIIATRLPDRNLIVPDFDVAGTYYGAEHKRTGAAGYTGTMKGSGHYAHAGNSVKMIGQHSPKTDFTRETGVFAYKGRVPASFFEYMIVPGSSEGSEDGSRLDQHAVRVAPADFAKAIEMVEEYGFYDPHYDPNEWEEDDQDDER